MKKKNLKKLIKEMVQEELMNDKCPKNDDITDPSNPYYTDYIRRRLFKLIKEKEPEKFYAMLEFERERDEVRKRFLNGTATKEEKEYYLGIHDEEDEEDSITIRAVQEGCFAPVDMEVVWKYGNGEADDIFKVRRGDNNFYIYSGYSSILCSECETDEKMLNVSSWNASTASERHLKIMLISAMKVAKIFKYDKMRYDIPKKKEDTEEMFLDRKRRILESLNFKTEELEDKTIYYMKLETE